ncbi:MAG: ParB N-terminal domain-containing protein [Gemmataceae bacterium]|nr:ParB N-terminal domain-containing protein [Gemmataceae bacterium]
MEHKLIHIESINFGERYRREDGDLGALKMSIENVGLLHAIVVTPHPKSGYILVSGGRRVRACRQLGRSMIHANVVEIPDRLTRLLAKRDENATHKPFTPSEGAAIGNAIESELGERRGRPGKEIPDNVRIFKGEETREIAAKAGGFGCGRTYERAKQVVANGTEQLVESMDAGAISIAAAAELSQQPKAVQNREIRRRRQGGKMKAWNQRRLEVPFDDSKVDKLLNELAVLFELRGKLFGTAAELNGCLNDFDTLTARWHEWAGKPAGPSVVLGLLWTWEAVMSQEALDVEAVREAVQSTVEDVIAVFKDEPDTDRETLIERLDEECDALWGQLVYMSRIDQWTADTLVQHAGECAVIIETARLDAWVEDDSGLWEGLTYGVVASIAYFSLRNLPYQAMKGAGHDSNDERPFAKDEDEASA